MQEKYDLKKLDSKAVFSSEYYFTYNGRILQDGQAGIAKSDIHIHPRLLGGKGGFGSMLRAIGARIEKTTNHEACRDLNGRRMRDVNNEKKISEWVQTQDEKEKERIQKHNDRIARTLNPTMKYEDTNYTLSLQGNVEKINDAIKIATEKKIKSGGEKRKISDKSSSSKKARIWVGVEGLSDEDSSQSEEDSNQSEEFNVESECKKSDARISQEETRKNMIPVSEESKISTEVTETKESGGTKKQQDPIFLDLEEFNSAEELQSVGLERLKSALMYNKMKCGGTLQERSNRLFLTKNKELSELDDSLFVKVSERKL